MLRQVARKVEENGDFVEVLSDDSADEGREMAGGAPFVVFEGNIANLGDTKTTELPRSEETSSKSAECYRGPDDPRLPEEILALPVGRRENFVNAFNSSLWFYRKSEDEAYDETKRTDENAALSALRVAHKAVVDSGAQRSQDSKQEGVGSESGSPQSSPGSCTMVLESGDIAHRIREDVVGIIIPGSLQEADRVDEGDVDVVIIREGWSLNERHYGEQSLADIAAMINENKPGFMDHGKTYGRDPRDWSVVLHSAEHVDDHVTAKMHIFDNPDGGFLRERIDKFPSMFGGSIDAFAMVEEGEAGGRKGPLVTSVVELVSWDIVMFPAAGGTIKGSTESIDHKESKLMDLATLKEKHPDLYALIAEQAKAESAIELKEAQAELATELKEAQAAVEAAQQESRDLKAKLDDIATAEKLQKEKSDFEVEVQSLVDEAFDDGEASEEFVAILKEEGPGNVERVKKMVAERRSTLDRVSTTGSETTEGEADEEVQSAAESTTDDDELGRFRTAQAS